MKAHITLGEYAAPRGAEPRFHLARADRSQHLYCVGKTGQGKSTLLFNMALQDVLNGDGVVVLDPHGELATQLLAHIPPE